MAIDRKDLGSIRYTTVGLELAVSIVLGLLGGNWLDEKFGTEPWLALLGLAFGTVAGFRFVWRAAKGMKNEALRDGFRDAEVGRDARFVGAGRRKRNDARVAAPREPERDAAKSESATGDAREVPSHGDDKAPRGAERDAREVPSDGDE